MNQRERDELDRHITGNYGEDSVVPDDEMESSDVPVTNPTFKNGCFVFGPTSWEDQKKLAKANWAAIYRLAGQLAKRREGR